MWDPLGSTERGAVCAGAITERGLCTTFFTESMFFYTNIAYFVFDFFSTQMKTAE
jgi:hypothetical protein